MTTTPIAMMVKDLLEKGVAHDAIVIAVEGAERAIMGIASGGSPVDTAADKRRAYDRDRKAKDREIHRTSGGNPRTSENASLSKQVDLEEGKKEREPPQRNVRGHRLPEDWKPEDVDWQDACKALGAERPKAELAKFIDHWKQQPGSRGVKLDWSATWRNWIRRAAEYRGGTQNGRRTVHDAARELHEQTVAAVRAFDDPAPTGIRDGTGQTTLRLLPSR